MASSSRKLRKRTDCRRTLDLVLRVITATGVVFVLGILLKSSASSAWKTLRSARALHSSARLQTSVPQACCYLRLRFGLPSWPVGRFSSVKTGCRVLGSSLTIQKSTQWWASSAVAGFGTGGISASDGRCTGRSDEFGNSLKRARKSRRSSTKPTRSQGNTSILNLSDPCFALAAGACWRWLRVSA